MTSPFLLILAIATLSMVLVGAIELARGLAALPELEGSAPIEARRSPRVSIVVAARNEADRIEEALATLLAQEYPSHEVVVVDDRSTDATGAILRRIVDRRKGEDAREARAPRTGQARPALRVLHVTELPPGWLGKNHALARGAELATGELLLFTDADVLLRRDALARAVGLMDRDGLDHLAVAPRLGAGGRWATLTVAVFLVVFSTFFKPWKARDPRSRRHIGIGAFNLVRAAAYSAVGGHAALALRPDDDLRLGRRVKEAGFQQAAALGRDTVLVEWYPSLPAMARGLRKNAFAVVDYRLGLVVAATGLPILFVFWPVAALLLTTGPTFWLNVAILAIGVLTTWDTSRRHGLPAWTALAYPVGAALLVWIIWSGTIATLRRGAIEWRGTYYPLDQLRRP